MFLLVLVLNQEEYLESILEKLFNIGITGATVIDSCGMGRTLCERVPFFGGFSSLLNECRPCNKTIFSVMRDEKMISKATEAIEAVVGDLEQEGIGIMFTFPLHQVKGWVPETENNQG